MRVLLLLIAFLANLPSQGQNHSFFNLDNPSTIDGKILNYRQRENNRFFTLRTYDVSGMHKDTSVAIKPDGTFFIRYLVSYPLDVDIQYSGTFVTLLQRAGHRTSIEFDDRIWEANENKSLAIKSTDEMSRVSATVIDFQYHFSKQQFNTTVDWIDKTRSDEELVNLRLQRMQEELRYLEKYIKERNAWHPSFQHWTKNKIIFDAGNDIVFTLFTNIRNKSFTHDQMFALLKHFPVDTLASALSSGFYTFAQLFAVDLVIIYNTNPAFESLRKQSPHNMFQFVLDKIDSTSKNISPGIWRQLLYYNLYTAHGSKQTSFYESRFYGNIPDKLLRYRMDLHREKQKKPFAEFDLLSKLKAYNVDASLKQRLISLFESRKDKYVFMDFWGTWCGPCMREMPHYAEFIARLKGKNISFLFMGVNTPEEEALKVKDKFKIEADFITLNKSENAILQNLLSVGSYPTHMLLRPGSMVTGYRGENISWGNNFNPGSVRKIETYLTPAQ